MIRLRTKITVDVSFYVKPDGTVAGLVAPSDLEAAALDARIHDEDLALLRAEKPA